MQKQTQQAINDFLQNHKQWQLVDSALHRALKFKDFKQAFAFMTQVAEWAEAMNHHPAWSNSYSRVEINLITTEIGAITELDIKLATMIEEAVKAV